MSIRQREVSFTIAEIPEFITEERFLAAQEKAKEAFVMDLLRHAEISAGRAAEMLKIDRGQLSNIMREYKISPFDETMTAKDLQHEVNKVMNILEREHP